MMEKAFSIEGLSKSYPVPGENSQLEVLSEVSLQADKGETVAIVGPSGCGKSTLLNILAGFESFDKGQVLSLGVPVGNPSVERAVVFQAAALFPWLTIRQNIGYGLKLRKVDKKTAAERIDFLMKLMELEGFGEYYPDQLSGGMQQRAALARVLILEPPILLMDEPFAALDAQTRMSMQKLLLNLKDQFHPAILFVTHDIDEAMTLADRIYILSKLPGSVLKEFARPWPPGMKEEILELLMVK